MHRFLTALGLMLASILLGILGVEVPQQYQRQANQQADPQGNLQANLQANQKPNALEGLDTL